MDTIFALATAQGRAGVAVIRVSGPEAKNCAQAICKELPAARRPATRHLVGADGDPLDHALVLVFDAPNSFTGEDVVEFHLHGSVAVVAAVLRELSETAARLAEPGEFTRRALENDKMDLAQVEGLADLIESETEAQRRQALRSLSGGLSARVETWRAHLIRSAALIEATIDFADEDVPEDVTPEVQRLLLGVLGEIEQQLEGFHAAERIRLGFEVAIVGAPNAGKSTLLNALAQREAAITSSIAGTTRDVIEVRMDLAGLPVTLLDTAGLRETDDEVEAIGVDRAKTRAEAADLRIFLKEEGEAVLVKQRPGDLVRLPKGDLRSDRADSISGLSGLGVADLVEDVARELSGRAQNAGLVSQERHRKAMSSATTALQTAIQHVSAGPDAYELAAEDIRHGVRLLESLVGRVDVENLLDEIFSSFCLGK